jgi:pimeloyl-ACP methyl ester carboxylesterase
MSIGAHLGAHLTAGYPERVSTLFVTGFSFFPLAPNSVFSSIFYVCSPVVVYLLEHGVSLATRPKEAVARISRGEGSLSLIRDVLKILFQDRSLHTIRRRALIIAATQERLLLPKDSIDSAKRLYQTVEEGVKRKVVQHRGIVHVWSIEQPELFGKTVRWWIEEGMVSSSTLPEEFEEVLI